jgi:hypothetical protein
MARDINYLTAGIILSIILLLFVGSNKFITVGVGITTSTAYFYFSGSFDGQTITIVIRVLILLSLCCVLPLIPTDKKLAEKLSLINVTSVVTNTLEERIKQVTSERLFRLSEVFREIECAFEKMDDDLDMDALKRGMLRDCKESLCKSCERCQKCAKSDVYIGYEKLIERGCLKGRVSLVDLPSSITTQ